jgi:outer membrane protein assembly factor BamB
MFAQPVILLRPKLDIPNDQGPASVLCYTAGQIKALHPSTGKDLWAFSLDGPEVPYWLGSWNQLVMLATGYQIMALEASTGRLIWSWGRRPVQVDSAAVDPEIFTDLIGRVVGEVRMVVFLENGEAAAVRLADGEPLWRRKLPHPCKGPIALQADRLVYATAIEGRYGLVLLNVLNGAELAVYQGEENLRMVDLCWSADGMLTAVDARRVRRYRRDLSEPLWTIECAAPPPKASICAGVDDLYLSGNGRCITRIDLSLGRPVWESEPLAAGPVLIIKSWLDEQYLYVLSDRMVSALERAGGRFLWRSELPHGFVVDQSVLAADYLVVTGNDTAAGQDRMEILFFNRSSGAVKHLSGVDSPADWCTGIRDVYFGDEQIVLARKSELSGLCRPLPKSSPGDSE